MKKSLSLVILAFICTGSFAQGISKADWRVLLQKEDSLKKYAAQIIQGINTQDQFQSDSIFTRILVRSLKTKNSFYYPFDSLETISRLYAPDSSFRIFTWQLLIPSITGNTVRQHGAIQMRTNDGSLKLFPLIDKSDVTGNIADTIGNNYGWIGAIYYRIILKKDGDQKYYTLLGFDENNIRSSRKIIEVLSFRNGEPIFGGAYFIGERAEGVSKVRSRYIMEFKKEAGPRLTYDKDLDMIITEHLVSESNDPNKKWTLVGDGDYEGFKWQGGKWVHVDKVFNVVTPDGQAPVPNPLRDASGNLDEKKLKGSEEEEAKPAPAKPKGKGEGE